jgi:hypothetical protein
MVSQTAKKCLVAIVGGAAVLGTGLALDSETGRNIAEYIMKPEVVESFAKYTYLIKPAGAAAMIAGPIALTYKTLTGSKNTENQED